MTLIAFPPIEPAPVRDFRMFDFTAQIKPALTAASITDASWVCTTTPETADLDPDPSSRLIGSPTFDQATTTQLIGDCIDAVVYLFNAQVTLSDGRILVQNAEMACVADYVPLPVLPDGSVPFDYNEWITQFPEFATLTEQQAAGYWAEAGLIFRNDASSPEQDPVARRELLDLLTAHLAVQFAPPPAGRGGGMGMVGRISSKSVNGVSVSSDGFPGVSGTQGWYLTTPYGAKFWRLTAAYRTFHYVPGPTRFPPGYDPRWPFGWPMPPVGVFWR